MRFTDRSLYTGVVRLKYAKLHDKRSSRSHFAYRIMKENVTQCLTIVHTEVLKLKKMADGSLLCIHTKFHIIIGTVDLFRLVKVHYKLVIQQQQYGNIIWAERKYIGGAMLKLSWLANGAQ